MTDEKKHYSLKADGEMKPDLRIPDDRIMTPELYIHFLNTSRSAMINFIMKLHGLREAVERGDKGLFMKLAEMGYTAKIKENGVMHFGDMIPLVGQEIPDLKKQAEAAYDKDAANG